MLHIRVIKSQTKVACKVRLHIRQIALTPFVKPCNVLNLAIWNVFNVQLYEESAFTLTLKNYPDIKYFYEIASCSFQIDQLMDKWKMSSSKSRSIFVSFFFFIYREKKNETRDRPITKMYSSGIDKAFAFGLILWRWVIYKRFSGVSISIFFLPTN